MKPTKLISFLLVAIALLSSCSKTVEPLLSPDGKYSVVFTTENESSTPTYQVLYKEKEIVAPSQLGFLMVDGTELKDGLEVKDIVLKSVDSSWKPPYGERNEYPEKYNESIITLAAANGDIAYKLHLRAYNEGVALRYEFVGEGKVAIEDELTEFAVDVEATAWTTPESQSVISETTVADMVESAERPLLLEYNESMYLAIGEADQIDYPRMLIQYDEEKEVLLPAIDSRAIFEGPFMTPWRYIMAGRKAGEILENNYLVLNLNAPSEIEDMSWLKPGKVIRDVTLTTTGGKACIDFAAANGLEYVIESAGWYGDEFTTEADASTVTVDPKRSDGPLDLHEVIRYGEEKGVGILVYLNQNQMTKQLDQVLPIYEKWGLKGIKYGFVNTGSQEASSQMHLDVRKAAKHHMILSIHDDYRPVGYSRTYPNLMTQEGIRGEEETPTNEHTLKTMFTRMIAGAGDNTICYFEERVGKVYSHATQLAKAVCLYSPLQWLYWYDRPQGAPLDTGGAGDGVPVIQDVPELEFFANVPTVWDGTKVIHSKVGVLGTIARRSGEDWFVGTINGKTDRVVLIPFNFLEKGKDYEAVIYYDDANSTSPTKVEIERMDVTSKTKLSRNIFKNEGLAIHIKPKN